MLIWLIPLSGPPPTDLELPDTIDLATESHARAHRAIDEVPFGPRCHRD